MNGSMTENGEENDYARDLRVGGRHSGVSVVMGGDFERGWCHTSFKSWRLGI